MDGFSGYNQILYSTIIPIQDNLHYSMGHLHIQSDSILVKEYLEPPSKWHVHTTFMTWITLF
jgi:hypothetical protein